MNSVSRYTDGSVYGVPLSTFRGVELDKNFDEKEALRIHQSCALGDALYDIATAVDQRGRGVFARNGMRGFRYGKPKDRPRVSDAMKEKLLAVVPDVLRGQGSPELAYSTYLADVKTLETRWLNEPGRKKLHEHEALCLVEAFGSYLEMCVRAKHWLAYEALNKQARLASKVFVDQYGVKMNCVDVLGRAAEIYSLQDNTGIPEGWPGHTAEARAELLRLLKKENSVPRAVSKPGVPQYMAMWSLKPPPESAIWTAAMVQNGLSMNPPTMDAAAGRNKVYREDGEQLIPDEDAGQPELSGITDHVMNLLMSSEHHSDDKELGGDGGGLPKYLADALEQTQSIVMFVAGAFGTYSARALILKGFQRISVARVSEAQVSLSEFLPRLLAAYGEWKTETSVIDILAARSVAPLPADVGRIVAIMGGHPSIATPAGPVHMPQPNWFLSGLFSGRENDQ